jgi:transcription elongation factor Elf1
MKTENCKRCSSENLHTKFVEAKNGIIHWGLYCKDCNSWIKWITQSQENFDYYSFLNDSSLRGRQLYIDFLNHKDEKFQLKTPLIMENNNKNGNSDQGNQTPMRTFSICLSDIPKEKIKVANNQKAYVSLTMFDNQQVDQYGNDFSIQIAKSKEDREAGVKTVYVGNGKIWGKKETNNSTADLPF